MKWNLYGTYIKPGHFIEKISLQIAQQEAKVASAKGVSRELWKIIQKQKINEIYIYIYISTVLRDEGKKSGNIRPITSELWHLNK